MNIKYIFAVLILLVSIFGIVVSLDDTDKKIKITKPVIAISTFSLYDIAKNISDDSFELVMILPFGTDAHSFEPTPKLMAKILQSDLVIYSGAGLEPWTESFEFKSKVIDMSRFVKLLKPTSRQKQKGKANDPHYWLDISNMKMATKQIVDALIELQPSNRVLYENNAKKYIAMLDSLDDIYKKRLDDCKKETIIVNHNAFSYISSSYGFNVESLSGLSPDAQPSAKSMARLINFIKKYEINTIFFESFVSDKAIKSIAKETDIKIDVLQPLGNITADEAKQKLSYEDIVLINIGKIADALECR